MNIPRVFLGNLSPIIRGGKIGLTRWVSPIHPELRSGWAIKLLAQKKSGQIWPDPIWPDPTRPARIFFTFKRLFGPISPIFRAGWATKILARKNRVNFGLARFQPSPLLARPSRLPALPIIHTGMGYHMNDPRDPKTRTQSVKCISDIDLTKINLHGSCNTPIPF